MAVSNRKPDRYRSPRLGTSRPVVAVAVALIAVIAVAGPASAHDYVVKSGDSLSVVARDHGVTTAELAAANGISNLHVIRVGQVLTIPGRTYEVRPGDSLSVIAARLGVSMTAIVQANGIADPHHIRVGQELRVPSGGAAARPADPAAGYPNLPGRLRANPDRLNLIPSFERWAAHYGVPPDLLMAMAYRESGWQTGVVSPKGAMGVGQLMPATAEWIAGSLIGAELDPRNPDDNIRMSARFLEWLMGYMGGEEAAVAGYYQGPGSVRAIGFYDDTQEYVDNVAQIRRLFAKG